MNPNYTTVTESPNQKVPREQTERLYQRYHFATQFCKGKDVLEVACGTGMGLTYLKTFAQTIVAGDIDEANLKEAQDSCAGIDGLEVKFLDAMDLQLRDSSFDVVILYEAIYYLSSASTFVAEARRVLRPNGILIICTVNKDWLDFNPSPFTIQYFSVPELNELLSTHFADIKSYGGFSTEMSGIRDRIVSFLKRAAIRLNVIPKTMKSKEFIKRIFLGKLSYLPKHLSQLNIKYEAPVLIDSKISNDLYKVIYTVATVQ